ncbi:MAG: hypothetical protein K6F07_03770 [Bacilli bacterium]|nr:hypothetical protein [Bacilli bacterium]
MPLCKLCFKEIRKSSIKHLLMPSLSLCENCYKDMHPHFDKFEVLGYSAIAIYHYDEAIKSRLYQFKGCFDIEINMIFLDRFALYYRLKFYDYVVIPAPSYIEDDERRGFNHVVEIFKNLKLPIVNLFVKTEHHKQADLGLEGRREIKKYIEVRSGIDIRNKKVLLVDDVFTTGSTMKTMIGLVEKMHPKDIKILVMSKTQHYQ